MGATSSSKIKKMAKVLTGITIFAVLAVAAPLLKGSSGDVQHVHNITIAGIAMQDKSVDQAKAALIQIASTLESQPVQVDVTDTTGKRLWGRSYTRQELGYKLDVDTTLNNAIEESNPTSLWQKLVNAFSHKKGIRVNTAYKSDPSAARAVAKRIAKLINRPAKDAQIIGVSGGVIKSLPEQTGYRIPDDAGPALLTAALQGTANIVIQCEVEPAKVTQANLRFTPVVLASATTHYNPGKVNRTKNVVMAAKNINNSVVPPHGEFSYNKVVGPRSVEEGFVEAIIFVKGKAVPGAGGGVCQVSTTLFQAVMKTGLVIKERHPHSMPVTYAKPGLDATVSYGAIDFRFENPFDKPVIIQSAAKGSRMTVTILGDASYKGEWKAVQEGYKPIHLPDKVVLSNKLPAGKRVVQSKAVSGYQVTTYRVKMENGQEVGRELIDRDRIRAQARVVVKGTGAAPQAKPSADPSTTIVNQ